MWSGQGASRVVVLVLLASLLGLAGCMRSLTGLHDAEVRLTTAPPEDPASLRARIERRLKAQDIVADVSVERDGNVTVVVDRDLAERVRILLAWRGGLALHVEADDVPLSAPAGRHVEEQDGRLIGRWPDLWAALRDIRPALPPGHRIVLELERPGRWWTRVVQDVPLVDLTERTGVVRVKEDAALSVSLGEEGLDAVRALPAGTRVVVVRGEQSLGAHDVSELLPGGGDALVLRVAEGPPAHAFARDVARLLRTEVLPPLEVTGIGPVDRRWRLAAANLLLPLVLAWAFLALVRRFDRTHPEPLRLVAVAFALGGLSTIPTLGAEMALMRVPWLNPEIASLGGQMRGFPAALLAFTISVGLVEELCKFGAAWLVTRRREFDEPIDGIVYGVAAALGFAAVENIGYLAAGRVGLDALTGRTFVAMPVHLFLGATWGYALGMKLARPAMLVWPWVLAAALVHGFFDAAVTTEGLAPAGILGSLALAASFTWLVRRLLRHGLQAPGLLAGSAGRVVTINLGSGLRFWSCAIVMYVSAMALTGWSAAHDATQAAAADLPWLAMILTLILVPLSAYGSTAFLPLDAVLDDRGISYAGTFRPWSSVTRVEEASAGGSVDRFAWIALVVVVSVSTLCLMPLVILVRLAIAGVASAMGKRPTDRSTAAWLLGTPQWVLLRSELGDLRLGPVDGHEGETLRAAIRERLAPPAPPELLG